MRSRAITEKGMFRLARRDCELYSVQIIRNAWGRCRVTNGKMRSLWCQPSLFAGSFWLSAYAEDGLIVENDSDFGEFLINWREPDVKDV